MIAPLVSTRSESGPARGPAARGLEALLLFSGCGLCVAVLAVGTGRRAWLERSLAHAPLQLALVAAALLVGAVALVRALRRRQGLAAGALVRAAFTLAVATAAFYLAFRQPFRLLSWGVTAAQGSGVLAAVVLCGPALARRAPAAAVRILDRGTFALALLVVGAEVGLRVVARLRPSPLTEQQDGVVARWVEQYRLEPGSQYFGFRVDERGFVDQRPAPPDQREGALVVSIADSFGLGVVPHGWHYTTVAERELADAAVYNVGVPSAGPPEYLHLLRTEVLPLQPDIVVVCLFVGNDLVARGLVEARHRRLRLWLDRSNLLLDLLPRRLRALRSEGAGRSGSDVAVGDVRGRQMDGEPTTDPERIREHLPWLDDPMVERPTFTPATHLSIQVSRARSVCRPDVELGNLTHVLDEIVTAAGPVPLAFVLIPDELQVEDDLWLSVAAHLGSPLDRNRPQRLLAAWFAERGVPCLDLLPALRAAEPLEDGRRHVYHLRDTHWNARGNEIAGRELAGFVQELLAR